MSGSTNLKRLNIASQPRSANQPNIYCTVMTEVSSRTGVKLICQNAELVRVLCFVWPRPSDPDILPVSLTLSFFMLRGRLSPLLP